jgi:hypothetical protein
MEEQHSAIGCLPKYKNGHLNINERDASMRLDMKKRFCLWSIFAVTGALVHGPGCQEDGRDRPVPERSGLEAIGTIAMAGGFGCVGVGGDKNG